MALNFAGMPGSVRFDGKFWATCEVRGNPDDSSAECPINPVPAGGVAQYDVGFANIELGKVELMGTVTVDPLGGNDTITANNSAELAVCSNGCSFDMPATPST